MWIIVCCLLKSLIARVLFPSPRRCLLSMVVVRLVLLFFVDVVVVVLVVVVVVYLPSPSIWVFKEIGPSASIIFLNFCGTRCVCGELS